MIKTMDAQRDDPASRREAIAGAERHVDSGALLDEIRRRVGLRTASQDPACGPALRGYLTDQIVPQLSKMGFDRATIHDNPVPDAGPLLVAQRHEADDLPTVLMYGHGDVVDGYDAQWRPGLSPWTVTVEGDRWYGRGTADNKGQHAINLAALDSVLQARGGRLGFNVKLLLETAEEVGSPGLHAFCEQQAEALAADVLIASDGPRLSAERPTVFLGSRGLQNFTLRLALRNGGHHSGNWGGLLRNPGVVLSHAIASLVDAHGRILVESMRPPPLGDAVREALSDVVVGGNPGEPAVDIDYGEPGLTPAERLFGWNCLEVLAFKTGNPDNPVSAIPSHAFAKLQLRFVVGTRFPDDAETILRRHLDARGFACVDIEMEDSRPATRLDPQDRWARWAVESMQATSGKKPALLPNLGGTCPNDAFEKLGMATLWVPHSYPGCSQHAPDEHLLASVAREGMRIMAGLFWDLGSASAAAIASERRSARAS